MTRIVSIFLLLFLFFFQIGNENIQAADCEIFTEEEIKQNVSRYLDTILNKTPTLNDLYSFEGVEAFENELPFEEVECKRKGWHIKSPECLNYIKDRAHNSENSVSYYFGFLKNIMKNEDKNLVINKITRPVVKKEEMPYVIVQASIGKKNLEFYHAGDICGISLGLVILTKIDGKPLTELVNEESGHGQ